MQIPCLFCEDGFHTKCTGMWTDEDTGRVYDCYCEECT